MKLACLTKDRFETIKELPVYLVGYSEAYWNELCDEYDVLPQIVGAFDAATRRQGNHVFRGKDIRVLGFESLSKVPSLTALIITDDYFREVYDQMESIASCSLRDLVVYYFPNRETRYDLAYRERYKHTPLQEIIVFRSGPHASGYVPGLDFADNARALFEYMLREGFDNRYELIWLVYDPAEYKDRFQNHPHVHFLPYSGSVSDDESVRDKYYQALCLAKYIFFTDAYGFARNARPDQIRVQLWHGCGIKRRVYFSPCEKRYEYTTVIGDMYAELHARDYGLRRDQVLVTGYPKDDWLFHPIVDWRERFHIPEASKYIFWMPTFRTANTAGLDNLNETAIAGETGLPIVRMMDQMEKLNRLLEEKDALLLIKLHPFQKREVVCHCTLSHVLFMENDDLRREDVQINQLLGHADALISDYSSVAVDYTLLDRPIAFTLDDYEIYGDSRGFNWPNVRDYLPGEELFSFDDFLRFVKDVSEGIDRSREKRKILRDKYHAFLDDNSSKRILQAFQLTASQD